MSQQVERKQARWSMPVACELLVEVQGEETSSGTAQSGSTPCKIQFSRYQSQVASKGKLSHRIRQNKQATEE